MQLSEAAEHPAQQEQQPILNPKMSRLNVLRLTYSSGQPLVKYLQWKKKQQQEVNYCKSLEIVLNDLMDEGYATTPETKQLLFIDWNVLIRSQVVTGDAFIMPGVNSYASQLSTDPITQEAC